MKNDFKIDFVGIAAAKSGTTWLAHMLDAHPQICVSEPKEVCYFNRELNSSETIKQKGLAGPFLNKNRDKPISWYANHFSHCRVGSIIGEYSPVYFYDPEAPYAIKRAFPGVKLIVALRNPIERAYSEYWMFRSSFKIEERPFDEAVRETGTMYIRKGLYSEQLARYFNLFPRSRIHIIFYDDIRKNPKDVMRKLYAFLGVDDAFAPKEIGGVSNYAKESRIKGSVEFMNKTVAFLSARNLSWIVRFLRIIKFNKAFLRIITKKINYPPMSGETREYLRGVFREDIKKLENLLCVDLSRWD